MRHARPALLLFLLLSGAAAARSGAPALRVARTAAGVSIDYAFGQPEVVSTRGVGRVRLDGCVPFVEEGRPVLPTRLARILLPPGTDPAGVSVSSAAWISLPAPCALPAAPRPRRLGDPAGPAPIETFGGTFPTATHEVLGVQYVRGHPVLFVRLHPVVYDGAARLLRYSPRMTVAVSFRRRPAGESAVSPRLRARGIDAA